MQMTDVPSRERLIDGLGQGIKCVARTDKEHSARRSIEVDPSAVNELDPNLEPVLHRSTPRWSNGSYPPGWPYGPPAWA